MVTQHMAKYSPAGTLRWRQLEVRGAAPPRDHELQQFVAPLQDARRLCSNDVGVGVVMGVLVLYDFSTNRLIHTHTHNKHWNFFVLVSFILSRSKRAATRGHFSRNFVTGVHRAGHCTRPLVMSYRHAHTHTQHQGTDSYPSDFQQVEVVGSGSVSLEWPRRYSPGNCYLPGVLQTRLAGSSLPPPRSLRW